MQRPLGMLVCALLLIPGAVAAQTKLEDNVNQAVTILERFREIPEQAIPEAVMRDAKGLAILTVLKAGFLFSGQGGLGLVVARTTTGRGYVSSKVGMSCKAAVPGGAAPRPSRPAAPASASRWAPR
jgi:lipid-binding SYLF domain-containing protein